MLHYRPFFAHYAKQTPNAAQLKLPILSVVHVDIAG
jgi:hypothetical protein